MRCVRPWPGDTDQVGRLAGAPPRAPGRRAQTGRRLAGARPGAAGPRHPLHHPPPSLAPCPWVVHRPCHLWPPGASHHVRGQTYVDVLRDGPHAPTSHRACL